MKHRLTAILYHIPSMRNPKPPPTKVDEEFFSIYNANRRIFDLEEDGYERIKLTPINNSAKLAPHQSILA
jgi:hypothetical protein